MDLFPYKSVRCGQRELLSDLRGVLASGENLVAHAPTGIGKTAAVVTPCLEYALENRKTVFFLAPKHTQHTIVIETLKQIHERRNAEFSCVDIIGKQWTCPHRISSLDSREFNEFCRAVKRDERCEYYNNVHKSRLSGAATKAARHILEAPLHAEEAKSICKEADLCPYEVSIAAGKKADYIVCDFFHLFSPPVRKAFLLKLEKDLEDSILIVDEAHNLPDRIRSILSVNLSGHTLKHAGREAAFFDHDILMTAYGELSAVLKDLGKGMKREAERYVKKDELLGEIREKVSVDARELIDLSKDLAEDVLSQPNKRRSHSKTVARFLEAWTRQTEGYARIYRKQSGTLTLRCLDPSVSSGEVFEKAHSSILMSGTLLPLSMYTQVLGLDPARTVEREYASPFPKDNRLCLIVTGLTTKYSERNDGMYARYAESISRILEKVPGNAAVFFPSYHVLDEVAKRLPAGAVGGSGKEVLHERQDMDKAQRRNMCARLASAGGRSGAVLLGVQAGSLSEGVDYAGNVLDCVMVVGLPLENPGMETKALIDYYDYLFEKGWDYGYTYPAMNRVLQASGRCIRSETDRGVIVLMDERFKWRNYAKCLPQGDRYIVTQRPEKHVAEFFKAGADPKET